MFNHLYIVLCLIEKKKIGNLELSDLNWRLITRNKAITPETVIAHPDWPWDYKSLNDNPNVNSNTVLKYPQIKWDFSEYSSTEKKTFIERIRKSQRIIVPYGYIRKNIEKMINNSWDYRKYKCLSLDSVLFSDIEFIINTNREHGRNIQEYSAVYIGNRNFCYKDIYKMKDKRYRIYNSEDSYYDLKDIIKKLEEFPEYDGYNSAVLIQRWWRKILKNRKKKRWFYFF